ncbi:MAG TPA: isoaspartyl peptidase/L-asparaginase [Solirubrobacteraceae bacterium]|nr:isoaspartyl peptidase/L-asparaginase [Solirubrobacteraceae bacterium]
MTVIGIHAGAGPRSPKLRDHYDECHEALERALAAGRELLESGAHAIAVVTAAVTVLEDFELFNAGRGAALCTDGSAQLSASLMRGADRGAGAVAGIRHTKNPILAAAAVLDSLQVLLIGEHADAFAQRHGIDQVANDHFVTERQLRNLRAAVSGDSPGTVGAVCLDADGALAAATSTGGITGQPPGRVGDSPVVGAGTWADGHVAVSCTGDGELFIRTAAARTVALAVEQGTPLADATRLALNDVKSLGGTGGVIACDAHGRVSLPYSTEAMPRGVWRAGGEPQVWVTEPG